MNYKKKALMGIVAATMIMGMSTTASAGDYNWWYCLSSGGEKIKHKADNSDKYEMYITNVFYDTGHYQSSIENDFIHSLPNNHYASAGVYCRHYSTEKKAKHKRTRDIRDYEGTDSFGGFKVRHSGFDG